MKNVYIGSLRLTKEAKFLLLGLLASIAMFMASAATSCCPGVTVFAEPEMPACLLEENMDN